MAGRNNGNGESLLCAFNDHGLPCTFYGMRSFSTFGGPWYCREHYYRMMGYNGMEGRKGNALPDPCNSSLVPELLKKVKQPSKGNLEKWLPREPGEEG